MLGTVNAINCSNTSVIQSASGSIQLFTWKYLTDRTLSMTWELEIQTHHKKWSFVLSGSTVCSTFYRKIIASLLQDTWAAYRFLLAPMFM